MRIYRIAFFWLITVEFLSVGVFGQTMRDKNLINKTLKCISHNDTIKARKKLTKISYRKELNNKNTLKKDYAIFSLNILPGSDEIEYLTKDSLIELWDSCRTFLNEWSALEADTMSRLIRRVDIAKVRTFNNRISREIIKLRNDSIKMKILQDSLAALNDTIAKKDTIIGMKRAYDESYDLDSLADDAVATVKEQKKDIKQPTNYIAVFQRCGINGQDLCAKLTVFVNDEFYGYPRGYYQSDALDYPIRIFAILIKSKLRPDTKMTVSINGEADSQTPDSNCIYRGDYGNYLRDSTIVNGKKLTNEQLAYLRAFNAMHIFQEETKCNPGNITTTDHLNDVPKVYGIKYRKIEMTIVLVDYYKAAFDRLPEPAQKSINVRDRRVKIENDSTTITPK